MIDLNDYIVKQEDEKSSRRLYKMICIGCNTSRGYQRKIKLGMGLCKRCASSVTHKNKISSELTKSRMKANHWSKKGHVHPFLGKLHTESTKIKISIATALQNKNYLARHPYNGPQGNIIMKSSWEVKYAQYLDSIGQNWMYEPMLKLSNGRMYLPDFQLSNGDIIEIKGYFRADARLKWDMFCNDYPNVVKKLITKVEMKQLGLIK